jgi:HK97 family phage major capsid protein
MGAPFKSQYETNIKEILIAGDTLGETNLALRIIRQGKNINDFYRAYSTQIETSSADRMLGLTPDETSTYSLVDLIRSQMEPGVTPARHERDVSSLITTKTGRVPNGEYVPLFALARDFNVGTASEAGNTIGAARLGDLSGDPLRKVFTLARMGATFVSGLRSTAKVPVFSSVTAAEYLAETGQATNVLETTALVDLSPKRIAVVFHLSRQALIQSTPELEAAVRRQMAAAIDEALQLGVFAGDGTGQNPTGLLNNAGVNIEVGGATGATLTFQHLVNMEYSAAVANVPAGARGWVINPATQKYLRTKARASGLPFVLGDDNQVLGAPVYVSGTMPADLTKSSGSNLSGLLYSNDWRDLLVGIYGGGIDVTVDRVTLASTGQVRVVAALEYGFGPRHPTGFSVMKDAALA